MFSEVKCMRTNVETIKKLKEKELANLTQKTLTLKNLKDVWIVKNIKKNVIFIFKINWSINVSSENKKFIIIFLMIRRFI